MGRGAGLWRALHVKLRSFSLAPKKVIRSHRRFLSRGVAQQKQCLFCYVYMWGVRLILGRNPINICI